MKLTIGHSRQIAAVWQMPSSRTGKSNAELGASVLTAASARNALLRPWITGLSGGVWGGMTERERRRLLRERPDVTSWRYVLLAGQGTMAKTAKVKS